MNAGFELVSGGPLSIVQSDGESAVVTCGTAFPPGSTLSFRFSRAAGDASEPPADVLKIKVRSCRRADQSQDFRIEGRFVSLPKTVRERLLVPES